MLSGEDNYKLLMEIQANRDFILMAYRQNPELLKHAEPRIRQLLGLAEQDEAGGSPPLHREAGKR
jgi:hypothetical protein